MSTTQTDRYYAFKAADDAFQSELTRIFKGNAGDMRYQASRWPDDAALRNAHKAFSEAGEAWRNGMVSTGRTIA